MKFYVSGDTHGDFRRFYDMDIAKDPNNGIIILGDASFNFRKPNSKIDKYAKEKVNSLGCHFYCVHGNHERRASDVPTAIPAFDYNVYGMVYTEPDYPNIHYFPMYGTYILDGYHCAVIGGAYSVDKYFRLQNNLTWFENEQMNELEKQYCEKVLRDKKFDFVFSHTCPYSMQPTELFIGGIDQSQVDNSTEIWMDKIKNTFQYNVWVWGHFHEDMLIRPHHEMYHTHTDSLDDITNRWKNYDKTGTIEDWWIRKSEKFYMI